MGSVRWRKVARDLVRFRARTILVVASIAMGVFAVGTIAGGQALLDQSLRDGYALAKGSNAILYTANPFDRTLVEVIRDLPGVGVAEGRRTVSVRVKTGDTWRQLQLTAIPDYRHQDIDVVLPERGDFPPKRGEVLFERSATTIADLVIGGDAVIELPGGKEKQLKIAGFAHEPGASPAYYFGRLSAYVTFDTLEDLGFDRSFQEIRIRAANPSISQKKAQTLADQVRFRMEKAGPAITFALIPTPGKHPAQELLDAIFIVLAGLGFLSLLVSGFLVANTVAVIMTQQTRQIGVMKAVGAGTGDIAALYLVLVGAYATLALLIAIPLAALAGYALAVFVTGLVNLDVQRVFVPVEAIELEILVGLVVPLLAAVVPVIRGTRVTVHQALRYTGVAETYGHGHPRPAASDAPCHAEHVPPQGPAHPNARRARAGRRGIHDGVHRPGRLADDDAGHVRVLQLRRPAGSHHAHPRVRGDVAGPVGAGREVCRGLAVRHGAPRATGRLGERRARLVRTSSRHADRSPDRGAGPLAPPGRGQRPCGHRQPAARGAGP